MKKEKRKKEEKEREGVRKKGISCLYIYIHFVHEISLYVSINYCIMCPLIVLLSILIFKRRGKIILLIYVLF